MSLLSSSRFELLCEPEKGAFSLNDKQSGVNLVQNARLLIAYSHQGKRRQVLADRWEVNSEIIETLPDVHHGPLHRLQIQAASSAELQVTITFALTEKLPLFLWKIALTNQSSLPVEIERIELLRVGGSSRQGKFQIGHDDHSKYSFYSNGWQSWSFTGTYLPGMTMRTSRLGFLQEPMTLNAGTPKLRQPGYYTADFFGAVCDLTSRTGLLVGFLSQREHFGTLEAVLYDQPSLRLWANGDNTRLDPGAWMETDWAVITPFSLDAPDPLGDYLQAVAREHDLQSLRPVPSGWCSWYHYFTRVTPAAVRTNLEALSAVRDSIPLDHFQIDDGFQSRVGDWFEFNPTFAEGIEPLAREIKSAGLTPGLWLAPFILHPGAKIIQNHPDWLLRDSKGRAVNCGFGWNTLTRGLDLTVPEALDYAAKVVHTAVHDWGYPYLKLDFLFAPAVKCRYSDPTRTRAQVLRAGMEALRKAAGSEAFLVGCGLPLGSAIGLVDSMRVGEDVSPEWYPQHFGIKFPFKNEPFMPSVRNSIHNTITRSPLHGRWWINDPDCLLVRPDSSLTLAEVQTLASVIAMSGGALLVSDDLSALPEVRRRIIEVLLPLIGVRPRVIDLFEQTTPRLLRLDMDGPAGSWHLLARFNWGEQPQPWVFDPQDFLLDPGLYILRSFWDGEIRTLNPAEKCELPSLESHGAQMIALRKYHPGEPAYVGSDIHISQGIEVSRWQPSEVGLDLELSLPRRAKGSIVLSLPRTPSRVVCNGVICDWSEVLPGRIIIPVEFDRQAQIHVT